MFINSKKMWYSIIRSYIFYYHSTTILSY